MDTSREYIKQCEQAKKIQDKWKPQVGDYIWRKYTALGEEIDSQIWSADKMVEIIILHFKSSVEGYWAAITQDGEERIFKTSEDLYKQTCVWLPRQDQLQVLSGLSWQEFDKACLKCDADTKEQAGIQVVMASNFNKKEV